MDAHLILIPLAKEYLDASENGGPRCKEMTNAAIKCLTTVINSKQSPTKIRVTARIWLAKLVWQETGRKELVENIANRGVQDATNGQLYREKLELEVILAMVYSPVNYPNCIKEAKALKDDALLYTFMLMHVKLLWNNKSGKERTTLFNTLHELQNDQLLAIQVYSYLVESIYWIERGNVEQATRCLGFVNNDEQTLGICPPQYRAINALAQCLNAMISGQPKLIQESLSALKLIDPVICNTDGKIYVTTFTSNMVALEWFTRQDLSIIIKLVLAIGDLFCAEKFENTIGSLNQVQNLISKCVLQGRTAEINKQQSQYNKLTEVTRWYQIYAYFASNQFNQGVQLIDQNLPKSPMSFYLKGMFCHSRGDINEAWNYYLLVRNNTEVKNELYLLASINLSSIRSSPELQSELNELCSHSRSALVHTAWEMLNSIYDSNIDKLTSTMRNLQSPQLQSICSLLTLPLLKPDNTLENSFKVAYHGGKNTGALMWARLALSMRRQRYLQFVNETTSLAAKNELINKAKCYDQALFDPRLDQLIMKDKM